MPKKKQVATRAIELGLSKLKISAFKEAALDFRSAMQIDPHNADGYYLLAKLSHIPVRMKLQSKYSGKPS